MPNYRTQNFRSAPGRLLSGAFLALALCAQSHAHMTRQQVIDAQEQWAQGIVRIGEIFLEKGDYQTAARDHIETLYAYGISKVMFKPTLAAEDQFRDTFEEALSYFVGGLYEEDSGFAIKPWTNVRFGEQQILVEGGYAIAMGNYYFTAQGSDEELKVEFTFGYMLDENGMARINAHHSSLPYAP